MPAKEKTTMAEAIATLDSTSKKGDNGQDKDAAKAVLRTVIDAVKSVNDPAINAELREALGASGATKRRKNNRKTTNDDASRLVASSGEVVNDEDFLPVPPDHVVNAGNEAVSKYHEMWASGYQVGETHGFNEEMIDSLMPGGEGLIR